MGLITRLQVKIGRWGYILLYPIISEVRCATTCHGLFQWPKQGYQYENNTGKIHNLKFKYYKSRHMCDNSS